MKLLNSLIGLVGGALLATTLWTTPANAEITVTIPVPVPEIVVPVPLPTPYVNQYSVCWYWHHGLGVYDSACHNKMYRWEHHPRFMTHPPYLYNYPRNPYHDQRRHEGWEKRHHHRHHRHHMHD